MTGVERGRGVSYSGGSRGAGGPAPPPLEKKNHVKSRDFYLFGGLGPPLALKGGGGANEFCFEDQKKERARCDGGGG